MKTTKTTRMLSDVKRALSERGFIPVSPEMYEKAVDLFTEYYATDPCMLWFGNGVYNPKITSSLLRSIIKEAVNSALVYTDGPQMNAICIWYPPGFSGIKPFPHMMNFVFEIFKIGGLRLIFKFIHYESFVMNLRKKLTSFNDWYLCFFAKNSDDMELTKKMIKPIVDYCWDNEIVCYVEAASAKKADDYKQLGFQIKDYVFLPESEVTHYVLMI